MILFVIYAAFLLALGLRDAIHEKKSKKADSFFYVNSRSSGGLLVGGSIIASCVGGSATIGMAGLAWQVGTPAFWWLGSGACGLVILCLFLAKKVRQSGAHTMPQMADYWMGTGKITGFSPRRLMALIIVPAWLAILAAQFTAMRSLVTALTNLQPDIALATGATLIAGYSALGGQASVMRSDMPQLLILAAGLVLALFWLVGANTCDYDNIHLQLVNNAFPPSRISYFLAVLGGSYVVCPMLFGRLLSARDEKAAVNGCRIAIIGLVCFAILVTSIGLAARGIVSIDCQPDKVLSEVIDIMPGWAAIPLLFSLLSAILSSADSCLVTASTVFCNDLLSDDTGHTAGRCRIAALALGILGWFLATYGHGILELLLLANDIYVSGVVTPVFFAMLLPRRAAPPAYISLLAIASGGLLGLAGAIKGMHELVYCGMGASGSIILAWALFVCCWRGKSQNINL